MARKPDGKRAKDVSATALLAYICIKLDSIPARLQTEYLKERRGVNLSGAVARQVGARSRWSRGPDGEEPESGNDADRRAVRPWLLVDEERLGLRRALVRFPGEGARQVDLIASLRRVAGVRQVFETRHARDVNAIVLFRPEEEDRLVATLEGLGRHFWDGISMEDHTPALETWKRFLSRTAAEEGLQVEQDGLSVDA